MNLSIVKAMAAQFRNHSCANYSKETLSVNRLPSLLDNFKLIDFASCVILIKVQLASLLLIGRFPTSCPRSRGAAYFL